MFLYDVEIRRVPMVNLLILVDEKRSLLHNILINMQLDGSADDDTFAFYFFFLIQLLRSA